MDEIWKPVVGYEGYYEVSSWGAVRSLDRRVELPYPRTIPGRMLKSRDSHGYMKVRLNTGVQRSFFVHRLVARAFLGEPLDGQEVCHNNGIKSDNRSENLRWGTRVENMADHLIHHGSYPGVAKGTHCSFGHPYKQIRTTGRNYCPECDKARQRSRYAARKATTTSVA